MVEGKNRLAMFAAVTGVVGKRNVSGLKYFRKISTRIRFSPVVFAVFAMPFRVVIVHDAAAKYDLASISGFERLGCRVAECYSGNVIGFARGAIGRLVGHR